MTGGPAFAERLIASSVDGIVAFDTDLRYTVWNPAMERLSGVAGKAVLGRRALEVFPFLEEIGEDRFFRAALAGETIVALDRFFTVPETERQGYFEGHYSPLYDPDGAIVGGLGIIRDITERKRATVRQEEFAEIVRSSNDAISGTHGNTITTWNPGAERLYGYPADEVIGKSVDILVPADRKQEQSEMLAVVLSGQRMDHFETQRITKDERIIDVSMTVSPIRGSKGDIIGVSAITRDITERKRAEIHTRQLETARLMQQQAVEINDTVVQGLVVARYALDADDSDKAKAALDRTLDSARALISQLLQSPEEIGFEPGDLRRSEAAEVLKRDGGDGG